MGETVVEIPGLGYMSNYKGDFDVWVYSIDCMYCRYTNNNSLFYLLLLPLWASVDENH